MKLRLTQCSAVVVAIAASVLLADEPATLPAAAATMPSTMPATTRAALPTPDQLIQHYIEATGGRAAYASLKTRRAEGTFSMADLGVEGKMSVVLRAGGDGVATIEIPNVGTIRQGVRGGIVWSIHPTQGTRILTGDEAAMTRRSLELAPQTSLDDYRDAKVLDVVALNGRPSYRMTLTSTTGTSELRLYDVESGLLVRTISKASSSLGELTVTTNFSDYEDAPPIRVPMKIQQMLPGASPESAMTKVEHNAELPDALFALPAEVAALLPPTPATTRPATTQSATRSE